MAVFRVQLIDAGERVLGNRDCTVEIGPELQDQLLDAAAEGAQAFAICIKAGGDVWGEDQTYARKDWIHAVANGATNLGYWSWVLHRRESRSKRNGV